MVDKSEYLTINCSGYSACFDSNVTVEDTEHMWIDCEGQYACSVLDDNSNIPGYFIKNAVNVSIACFNDLACQSRRGTISDSSLVQMHCFGSKACILTSLVCVKVRICA